MSDRAATLDFRRLFEAAPGLFLVLQPDAQFTILGASDAYLAATLTQRDAIVGRGLFQVFPDNPNDPGATGTRNLRSSLERVLTLKCPDTMAVQKYDIRRPESDGGGFEVRFWSPVNSPVLSDSGRILYIIHRVEDVTEFVRVSQLEEQERERSEALKQRVESMQLEVLRRSRDLDTANRELRVANERLKELDKAKTTFFSNISHEFRTPLTLLLGPVEDILADRGEPSRHHDRLRLVHHNALRMLKLVNALLDFSRIEAGRERARFAPTDLARLTEDFASTFRSAAERAGLRLVVDCAPLAQPAYVDRDMWEKIVLNLLSNAFKFTFEGEIAVRLWEEASWIHLAVQDTGGGIPEAEIGRVFQRFHRVQGTRARTHEGTGIGLSLVQELVRLHGGTVAVQSRLGAGAAFTVSIPRDRNDLPGEAVDSAPADGPSGKAAASIHVEEAERWLDRGSAPSGAPAPSAARILVADDNADLRAYVSALLAEEYVVEAVADGAAALAAARERRPDLVLSDVMMPRLDGFGLLRELRADVRTRTIPVILLSARAGEESTVEGLDAGADDYLMKPFSTRELLARVRAHLGHARSREQWSKEIERLTELRKLELATFQSSKLESIGRLAGGVAHDFNNLLTAMVGYSELVIARLPVGDSVRTDVEEIRRAGLRAATLTKRLLAFGRKQVASLRVLDLSQVLREMSAMLGRLLGEHIEIELALAPLPCLVRADPGQMEQVVLNLAVNARDAMPRGGRLTLATDRVEPAGDGRQDPGPLARLSVTDSGTGMDAETRARLFEPFFTTKEVGRGTGLGLSTVLAIVRECGGSIDVESELGRGTTFRVLLPRVDEPMEDAPREAPQTVSGAGTETVLVVEDEECLRKLVAIVLRSKGHRVLVAGHGVEAMEVVARFDGPIHLLVTDVMMPGLTGPDLAVRLTAARPGLRVLYTSAYGSEAIIRDGVLQEGVEFLQKPYTPDDLAQRVREVLDKRGPVVG